MAWPISSPIADQLFWLKVPKNVFQELRRAGFHHGYSTTDGVDAGLSAIFDSEKTAEQKTRALQKWQAMIARECALLRPGYPALWHPQISEADTLLVRKLFGPRLVEIVADDLEAAWAQLRVAPWLFGVFYHVAAMGDWKTVVVEQLGLLRRVGLQTVYVTFLGSDADFGFFAELARAQAVSVYLLFRCDNLQLYEIPVMGLIQEWAQANPGRYLLYFHTKGVSAPGDLDKIKWRRLMQRCVIARWRENAARLDTTADAVGVGWLRCPPISHFPGNFWMVKTDLIQTLEPFDSYYLKPRHSCGDHFNQWRLGAEFWIGSARIPAKIDSLAGANERLDRPEYWNKTRGGKEGYLALCLWCKDEHEYLGEWLDYHLALGVDHIFVYDNNSRESLAEALEEYIADGVVTVLRDQSQGGGRQCRAYARILKHFGPYYEWFGFIDVDEFVVPKSAQSLPEFLRHYEQYGGVGIFWYCFGSNGHVARQSCVTKAYTARTPDSFHYNDHIKTFVRTPHVLPAPAEDPHQFVYRPGYHCVDEHGQPIEGPRRQPRSSDLIQLNHYICRSREDWSEKLARGGGNGIVRTWSFFDEINEASTVEDPAIAEVIARLSEEESA